jgi:hypothetical protein
VTARTHAVGRDELICASLAAVETFRERALKGNEGWLMVLFALP